VKQGIVVRVLGVADVEQGIVVRLLGVVDVKSGIIVSVPGVGDMGQGIVVRVSGIADVKERIIVCVPRIATVSKELPSDSRKCDCDQGIVVSITGVRGGMYSVKQCRPGGRPRHRGRRDTETLQGKKRKIWSYESRGWGNAASVRKTSIRNSRTGILACHFKTNEDRQECLTYGVGLR